MTSPDPQDTNAVGGSHPGTQSQDEIASKISFSVDTNKNIAEVASKVLSAAEWQYTSFTDVNSAPKYVTEENISFYGNGSLSLVSELGKLLFSSKTNENSRGAFSLDHSNSNFYSNLNNTTLGSLNIDTVDGYELNPLSPIFPSTNFSPTKPWVRKLFPVLSTHNLMTIAILELIHRALARALSQDVPEDNKSKTNDIDMATIIVDNQIIENQIFGV